MLGFTPNELVGQNGFRFIHPEDQDKVLINQNTPKYGKITIRSEIQNGNYVISVQDTGIGLTEEEKKKIFKKFGKVERYGQGLDVVSEGSGLGLYISKKIIELHEGNIWVESEGRKKGSIFYFSLPIIKN